MLGEVIYEEKGQTTGIRVLSSENGFTKVEVSLQTEGTIRGVGHKCFWTYTSETRPDGSVHGGGKGFMTTADGDVINLDGSGVGKLAADGSVGYRGTVYFHSLSPKSKSSPSRNPMVCPIR